MGLMMKGMQPRPQSVGTKGRAVTSSGRARLEGGPDWIFSADNPNPYQVEHHALHESIRGDSRRLNEGHRIAESTMTAIMGRMAAYSGKDITWEEALNAQLDMRPEQYDFVELEVPQRLDHLWVGVCSSRRVTARVAVICLFRHLEGQ